MSSPRLNTAIKQWFDRNKQRIEIGEKELSVKQDEKYILSKVNEYKENFNKQIESFKKQIAHQEQLKKTNPKAATAIQLQINKLSQDKTKLETQLKKLNLSELRSKITKQIEMNKLPTVIDRGLICYLKLYDGTQFVSQELKKYQEHLKKQDQKSDSVINKNKITGDLITRINTIQTQLKPNDLIELLKPEKEQALKKFLETKFKEVASEKIAIQQLTTYMQSTHKNVGGKSKKMENEMPATVTDVLSAKRGIKAAKGEALAKLINDYIKEAKKIVTDAYRFMKIKAVKFEDIPFSVMRQNLAPYLDIAGVTLLSTTNRALSKETSNKEYKKNIPDMFEEIGCNKEAIAKLIQEKVIKNYLKLYHTVKKIHPSLLDHRYSLQPWEFYCLSGEKEATKKVIEDKKSYSLYLNFDRYPRQTIFHLACLGGSLPCVKEVHRAFGKNNYDWVSMDAYDSPLHCAVLSGSDEVVRYLFDHANTSFINDNINAYNYLLYRAADSGSVHVMHFLYGEKKMHLFYKVEKKEWVHELIDDQRAIIFFSAVRSGSIPAVQYLINTLDFDPKIQSRDGNTKRNALNAAVESGSVPMMEYINKILDITPINREMVLRDAIRSGYIPGVEYCLNTLKIHPNDQALFWAIYSQSAPMVLYIRKLCPNLCISEQELLERNYPPHVKEAALRKLTKEVPQTTTENTKHTTQPQSHTIFEKETPATPALTTQTTTLFSAPENKVTVIISDEKVLSHLDSLHKKIHAFHTAVQEQIENEKKNENEKHYESTADKISINSSDMKKRMEAKEISREDMLNLEISFKGIEHHLTQRAQPTFLPNRTLSHIIIEWSKGIVEIKTDIKACLKEMKQRSPQGNKQTYENKSLVASPTLSKNQKS